MIKTIIYLFVRDLSEINNFLILRQLEIIIA